MYEVYLSMRHTPLSMYYAGWIEKGLGSHNIRIHNGFDRIRCGELPFELKKQIQTSQNFIVILTPETFGYDDDDTSWMAQEIETAIQSEANIIPIMSMDFVWPKTLPPRISSIKDIEGIIMQRNMIHLYRGSMPFNRFSDFVAAIMKRLQNPTTKESVFISYSTKDSDIAYQTRNMLERHGFSCWMAPHSIPAGGNYASIIPEAIGKCEVFLLFLSKNSQESTWVPKELDIAINSKRTIIPFQIDDSSITPAFNFYLTNCQRILAVNNLEDAYWKLRESIFDALSY